MGITSIGDAIRPIDSVHFVFFTPAEFGRDSTKHFESFAQQAWDNWREETARDGRKYQQQSYRTFQANVAR